MITVLIADDHPVFRRGLIQVLQSDHGLRVVGEAADGETALRLIRERRPAVSVLDIAMPRGDGIAVAQTCRREQLPGALLFLTAHRDPQMLNEALNLGVQGYVLKDSAVLDIIAAVRAVATGNRYVSPSLSDDLLRRIEGAQALRDARPGLELLSPAERRILRLVSLDHTSKEIADSLGISPRTVENHRTHIAQKLGLQGCHSLLKFAYDNKARL